MSKPEDPVAAGDGAAPDTAVPAIAAATTLSTIDNVAPPNLEQQIGAALNGAATPAEALAALIAETSASIIAADETAELEKARMTDPALSPDPREAKAAMEDALIRGGRLRTLLPRLIAKHSQVEAAERLAQWEGDYLDLEKERDELASEVAEVMSDVVTLVDLFQRVADLDRRIAALHQSRPTGCGLHLDGVELTARGLAAFGRDIPSIIKATVLFDFSSGRQLWPPVVPRDMSIFAPMYAHNPRYTNRWWEAQAAEAAALAEDARRVNEYYEAQYRAQIERERKEGR
jgi:hypothetical protein